MPGTLVLAVPGQLLGSRQADASVVCAPGEFLAGDGQRYTADPNWPGTANSTPSGAARHAARYRDSAAPPLQWWSAGCACARSNCSRRKAGVTTSTNTRPRRAVIDAANSRARNSSGAATEK